MKKWKSICMKAAALAMLAAFCTTVGAEEVKAEEPVTVEPAWEFDFDGTLEGKSSDGTVTAQKVEAGAANEYSGEAAYVEGVSGQAIQLGNYGLKMNIPNQGIEYTISFWAKSFDVIPKNSPMFAVGCNIETGIWKQSWVAIAGDAIAGKYQFWGNGSPLNYSRVGELFDQPTGKWTHYVLAVKPDRYARIYENGQEIIQGFIPNCYDDEDKDLYLGVNFWTDKLFNGCIDEVKVYAEYLLPEQIEELYNQKTMVKIQAPENRYIEPGGTLLLNLTSSGNQEGIRREWESDDRNVATVDSDGAVTGISPGSTMIRVTEYGENDAMLSTDEIQIRVRGGVIADFTFDDAEDGFLGAGAKVIPRASFTADDFRERESGSALYFNGTNQWMNVVNEDGSPLLTGLEELTLSFDSQSDKTEESWPFYAGPSEKPSPVWGVESYYLGVTDRDGQNVKVDRRYGEYPDNVGIWNGKDNILGAASEEWKHIDVVFKSDETILYIDKVEMSRMENTVGLQEILGSNSFVQIGKGNWWSGQYFKGQLDNYKIYDYALTEDEIIDEPEEPDQPEYYANSLTLQGNIGVNWYVALPEEFQNSNTKMEFTYQGSVSYEDFDAEKTCEPNQGEIYFGFTFEVPAKEMTDLIEAKLVVKEGEIYKVLLDIDTPYSVKTYAETMIADPQTYGPYIDFAKAMLHYGASAQVYFNHKDGEGELANAGIEERPFWDDMVTFAEYKPTYAKEGNEEIKAAWYANSLILQSETTIRSYIKIEDSEAAEGAYLKYNNMEEGIELSPHKTLAGIYYADIKDIAVDDLDKSYAMKIYDSADNVISSTKTCSAFSYGYSVLNAGNSEEALVNLMKAMYAYHNAAITTF